MILTLSPYRQAHDCDDFSPWQPDSCQDQTQQRTNTSGRSSSHSCTTLETCPVCNDIFYTGSRFHPWDFVRPSDWRWKWRLDDYSCLKEKKLSYNSKTFCTRPSLTRYYCGSASFLAVFRIWIRIRIHRIHMFLGLPDPDPDPSIIMQK